MLALCLLNVSKIYALIITYFQKIKKRLSRCTISSVMQSRLFTSVTRVILFMLSTAACVIIAEFALQISHFHIKLQSEWTLGRGVRVRNEEACLINPEFSNLIKYQKKENEKLIIALGDSFTKGYPEDGHGYPEQLQEKMLATHGQSIKILNFGFEDSSPDQQLRIFQKFILPSLKPDILIWSFYPNDIYDNSNYAMYDIKDNALKELDCHSSFFYVRDVLDTSPIPEIIKKKSLVYRLILKSTEVLIHLRIPQQYKKTPDIWGYKKVELEMKKMKELAQQNNFETYFVTIAPQTIYINNPDKGTEWANTDYQLLKKAIQQTHSEEINTDLNFYQPASPSAATVLGISSDYGNSMFSDIYKDPNPFGDRHFNSAGYQMFAERMYDTLEQNSAVLHSLK
jgi:lysophospholipase L1-like esterase